ncbi:MAG: polysaccharide deacetylase family protein [Candidatus Omnitrophica bacterium]|nr:polysaccharide deacetylase family protein [Candidatus Omnitrophota bacterium]MCM8806508.1 polysaccharide deacetylase family protein [Candidatus Omnitrophota bacterium]
MVLSYHRVNPWYKSDALTVNIEEFKKQIEYLIFKKFKFLKADEYISTGNEIRKKVLLTFDDGFADNYWFAYEFLEKLNIKPLIFLVVNYINTDKIFLRYKSVEKDRFLNWKEIFDMAKNGVEFGSHTLTHPHLTLLSEEKIKEEIINSKKMIEDKLGKEVKFFCYPYGEFNKKIEEIVKKSGYKKAFVTPKRFRRTYYSNFTIKRVGIYGHNNFLIFKFKIWKEYLKENF